MSSDDNLPAHSELSPSSADGWTGCAGYINANCGLPDTTSWEAAEGTAAHWIRNECLTNGEFAENYIGHEQQIDQWTFVWTDDDARLLQPGIDRLRAYEGQFFGEHWVDLTEWLGLDSHGRRQGGTLDAGVLLTDGRVCIDDEKWGRGVPVLAKNSKQIRLYALGFGREQGITDPATEFILQIDQPRHMGGGGSVTVTWGELLHFGEWIKERAAATRDPDAPRTPGLSQCQWCRRKTAPGGCDTFDQYFLDQLMVDLDDLDEGTVTLPATLTPERRATLLLHRKMIESYLEHLYGAALGDALASLPVGRMKAVEDRKTPDAWHDGKATTAVVEPILRAKSFTQKLITPTQMCKLIPQDSFDRLLVEPLIKRGRKTVVLVSEEDPRSAVVTEADLEDLDDIATGETE